MSRILCCAILCLTVIGSVLACGPPSSAALQKQRQLRRRQLLPFHSHPASEEEQRAYSRAVPDNSHIVRIDSVAPAPTPPTPSEEGSPGHQTIPIRYWNDLTGSFKFVNVPVDEKDSIGEVAKRAAELTNGVVTPADQATLWLEGTKLYNHKAFKHFINAVNNGGSLTLGHTDTDEFENPSQAHSYGLAQ